MTTHRAPDAWQRYRPWRRWVEIGLCLAFVAANAAGNSATTWIDLQRSGASDYVQAWEPVAWEWTSATVWLALLPAIAWFTHRFPTHWDNWPRRLPMHLAASAAVSLVHVLGMVAFRALVYRLQGASYDFGPWPEGLWYEYLKDVRSYAIVVLGFEGYRLLLRRMQGEARVLDPPDAGLAGEPQDRPERFLVRKLGREFLVAAREIEWAQAAGNYVNLHVAGRDYPLRSTMAEMESRLDPKRFTRIHRSYFVNLDHVASIEPLEAGDARVHLVDGTTLPCSRRHRDALRDRIATGMLR